MRLGIKTYGVLMLHIDWDNHPFRLRQFNLIVGPGSKMLGGGVVVIQTKERYDNRTVSLRSVNKEWYRI